jgi:hypothetical protein
MSGECKHSFFDEMPRLWVLSKMKRLPEDVSKWTFVQLKNKYAQLKKTIMTPEDRELRKRIEEELAKQFYFYYD